MIFKNVVHTSDLRLCLVQNNLNFINSFWCTWRKYVYSLSNGFIFNSLLGHQCNKLTNKTAPSLVLIAWSIQIKFINTSREYVFWIFDDICNNYKYNVSFLICNHPYI